MLGAHHCLPISANDHVHSAPSWDRAGSLSPMASLQVTTETSGEECKHLSSKGKLSSVASEVPGG